MKIQNEKGITTLHGAATKGRTGVTKAILDSVTEEQKYNLLSLGDSNGDTALMHAAHNGHTETDT